MPQAHLVPIDQALPGADEPLPDEIVLFCHGERVLVKIIVDIAVTVVQQPA
jgi:hypothetical protein